MKIKYTIGIDFGTNFYRVLVVNILNGSVKAHAFSDFRLWKAAKYCEPNKIHFKQHPILGLKNGLHLGWTCNRAIIVPDRITALFIN